MNASGDRTGALLLQSVLPQPKLNVSTGRPVRPQQAKSQLCTLSSVSQALSLLAKSDVAQRNPTPVVVGNRGEGSVLSPKGAQGHQAERGPETSVPPAGFLRPGIRRHKGRRGEGPDGSDGAKPPPPLAERGPRRRASPASAARPLARGGPGPGTALAVTLALGRAGHLSARSPKPTLLCKL